MESTCLSTCESNKTNCMNRGIIRGEKEGKFHILRLHGQMPWIQGSGHVGLHEHIRAEYPVEYAFIHPMLCDEDGERFFADFLRKDRLYVIAGCAPVMQKKLFRDAFEKAGLDINKDLVPLDVRNMTTEKALETVKKALEAAGQA